MAGELAAEWIKIPDGNGNLQKVWVRDSTARRDISQLQTDVSGKADAATTLAGYGITDAYTKTQVDGMIPSVPSAYTSNPSMDGTASPGSSTAWARGDHVHPHDSTKADVSAIPTKTSDLTNDSGFITSAALPTKTSDLTNDSGFITSAKFAVITCTLSASNSYGAYTALPSGFTYGNCVILSVQVPDGSGERVGQGIFTTTNMRLFAEVSANGVRVYNNTSRYYSVDVKVTLMRTDI